MATASLALAALAIAASFLPPPLHLAALTLAIGALVVGIDGFRDKRRAGSQRLWAAAGMFVGGGVLLAGTAKVVITALAIRHLAASL